MWFRNIRIFQFEAPISYEPEKIGQALEDLAFKPCPKSLPASYGWVAPTGDPEHSLAFAQENSILLRLRIEEKVLPPSVVRETVMAEIKQIEAKTGRRIYKDEKERIRDDTYQTLLSQAFSKSTYINGYIDTEKNWLIVDCASSKRLAQFISSLHKCLDIHAYAPEMTSIPRVMTDWLLNNKYPNSLCLANACLLKELDENGSVIRVKNEDLLSDKIQSFLKDGSVATQLSLEWSDQILFTLKEDFSISSIKFLEAVKDLARDGMTETKEERFAVDFTIMTKTLRHFIADLLPSFLEKEKAENEEAVAV